MPLLPPDVAWIDAREMGFGRLILKPSFPVLPVLQANEVRAGVSWRAAAPTSFLDHVNGVPRGIRTPVTAVKGRCPRPG